MYYELKRLLESGERCILTGIKGSGKSTLISKLSSEYNSFRSMWYCSECTDKKLLDRYQLFDRCNFIDRYAYQYKTEDALESCIFNFKESFENTILFLMLNDKWAELRQKNEDIDNKIVTKRMLHISFCLLERRIIKYLIISTKKGWWSSEFADIDLMKESMKEEGLW